MVLVQNLRKYLNDMLKKLSYLVTDYIITFQILILSLFVINSNIHIPCLPEIQNSFCASEQLAQISFIVNPFIAVLVSLPFGILSDIYGRKIYLLYGLFIFISGTVIIVEAHNIYVYILGRFLQSLGDGGAALVSGIIIGDCYKGKEYAKIQAILSITLALAWAGAPLLGEMIFVVFGWRGNFVFILIVSLLLSLPLFLWNEKKSLKKTISSFADTLHTTKKIMMSMLNASFLNLSLSQAFPLGMFTAFEFMMPFIYKTSYGHSVKGTSFALFIFIFINIAASLLYRVLINYAQLKEMFRWGMYIFFTYLIIGFLYLNNSAEVSESLSYFIFGFLSFSLPFIIISSTAKIVDSHPLHLGFALSFLTIIRNAVTTGIPLVSCMVSENTFHSFFNVNLIFGIIGLALLFKGLKQL